MACTGTALAVTVRADLWNHRTGSFPDTEEWRDFCDRAEHLVLHLVGRTGGEWRPRVLHEAHAKLNSCCGWHVVCTEVAGIPGIESRQKQRLSPAGVTRAGGGARV